MSKKNTKNQNVSVNNNHVVENKTKNVTGIIYADTDSIHTSTEVIEVKERSVGAMVSNLDDHTRIILSLEEDNKHNIFKIASQLELIKSHELYKEGGYTSVTEYGEKELSYKPSTTSALVRISQRFLDLEGNVVDEHLKGYSLYQLMELLKLNDTELKKAIADSTITPALTTKNIRSTINGIKENENKLKGNKTSTDTKSEKIDINETTSDTEIPVENQNENEKKSGLDKGRINSLLASLMSSLAKEDRLEVENQTRYINALKDIMSLINDVNI